MIDKRPLPEVPYKEPMLDANGVLTPRWQRWFNELYVRMGGKLAPSNLQLEATLGGITMGPQL